MRTSNFVKDFMKSKGLKPNTSKTDSKFLNWTGGTDFFNNDATADLQNNINNLFRHHLNADGANQRGGMLGRSLTPPSGLNGLGNGSGNPVWTGEGGGISPVGSGGQPIVGVPVTPIDYSIYDCQTLAGLWQKLQNQLNQAKQGVAPSGLIGAVSVNTGGGSLLGNIGGWVSGFASSLGSAFGGGTGKGTSGNSYTGQTGSGGSFSATVPAATLPPADGNGDMGIIPPSFDSTSVLLSIEGEMLACLKAMYAKKCNCQPHAGIQR